jgi:acyl carrier protein
MAEHVIERIVTIMVENFDVDPGDITANTEFETLGLDSLVLVELAVILEREFGVGVTDEELIDGGSFGGVADLVAAKRAESGTRRGAVFFDVNGS